ncbi:MAG: fumarylacetoacetate hydrolase family protein [Candidatus Lambdaproteobacteria bacterium]|nr:fumarylacetoacetate hydrolase family protein [Candidatus Lambdaproteobacteria bacterium]
MKGRTDPIGVPIPVGKIVCIGRNYVAHIEELKNEKPSSPMFFLKPTTALRRLEDPIRLPAYSKKARHELELAALIGKTLSHCREDEVLAAISGYAVAIDVTLQDVQDKLKEQGHPWEIAKAFDGSCPISPFVPAAQVPNPQDVKIVMRVNGQLRHNDSTALMIYKIPTIVAAASQYFTLEPGDIVLTGTPAGVGSLEPGDTLEMEIQHVGAYTSSVAR